MDIYESIPIYASIYYINVVFIILNPNCLNPNLRPSPFCMHLRAVLRRIKTSGKMELGLDAGEARCLLAIWVVVWWSYHTNQARRIPVPFTLTSP